MQNHSKLSMEIEDAKSILRALNAAGFAARFAGGCVRDRLLGVVPKDFDIATTAKPEEIETVASNKHWKSIPTGIDHGTVTIVLPSGSCEVTTLRKDVKTDGRHAVVEFNGATFEDDARRRDFTINAMYEDVDGNIYDYHDGKRDIQQRILRFVGLPIDRVREDYLRILRFFRFWSQLDFKPDPQALAVMPSLLSGLDHISQERISSELWKIMSGIAPADAVQGMENIGLLKKILPEGESLDHGLHLMINDASRMQPPQLKQWTILSLLMGITNHRFWNQAAVSAFGKRMKWSDQECKTMTAIFDGWSALGFCERKNSSAMELIDHVEQLASDLSVQEFFAPIWFFCAEHARDSSRRDILGWVMSIEAAWGPRRVMTLPVSGRDVMDLRPDLKGAAIGEVLLMLKRSFRNNEWNSRQEGLELIRKFQHKVD